MFVRSRKAKGSIYHAVVESYREGGKTKHRQVAALGRHQHVEDAIAAAERDVRQGRRRLARIAAGWPDNSPLPTRTARENERITQKLALQKERLRLLADVRNRLSANRSATAPAERQDA